MNVRVLIGSKKGAFVLESDSERRDWRVRGPFCEHWPLTHVAADLADGTIYATGGNAWFGPAVWKSSDGGVTWTHSSQGLAYPAGRDAGAMRLGGSCRARAALRRRRAGGAFCQRRWRREFSRGGGPAPTPLAPAMAAGRDRPCAALHRLRSRRRASALGRHLLGRRVLHGGRRRNLEPAQFGHALRLSARGRALSRVRPVRAQPDARAGPLRPPLPAKPLRHVPQRRRRRVLAQHRERPPVELWLSCRRASPRRRHAVLPAAQRRHQGPLSARRARGRLALARRRRALGSTVVRGCLSPAHISA